jgi:hypothetical protein
LHIALCGWPSALTEEQIPDLQAAVLKRVGPTRSCEDENHDHQRDGCPRAAVVALEDRRRQVGDHRADRERDDDDLELGGVARNVAEHQKCGNGVHDCTFLLEIDYSDFASSATCRGSCGAAGVLT